MYNLYNEDNDALYASRKRRRNLIVLGLCALVIILCVLIAYKKYDIKSIPEIPQSYNSSNTKISEQDLSNVGAVKIPSPSSSIKDNQNTQQHLVSKKIYPQPVINTKQGELDKLITALRFEPFFDIDKLYPEPLDKCSIATSISKNSSGSTWDVPSYSGVYFSVTTDMADIHLYDKDGRHTGPVPKIPGYDFASPPEEGVQGTSVTSFGSSIYLSLHENIDGKIKIIGKKYGYASFGMRGDGNACGIVEIWIPVTPHSVGMLPLTSQGDVGPFSYDIDGDGKQDFLLSLLHPLLPEKQIQLDAVIDAMKNL